MSISMSADSTEISDPQLKEKGALKKAIVITLNEVISFYPIQETRCGLLLIALLAWCTNGTSGNGIDFIFVNTNYGRVKGLKTELANVFYGIPYAQPPVGDLRWRYPQEVRPWKPRILDTTEPKAWCPQPICAPNDTSTACPPKISEDCIYLNIWTPRTPSVSLLPVMLFIHGGNFRHMGSTSPLFDGRYLVSKGQVIYVSFNYRLGALGYLRTEERGEENFGIMDQSMAMRWVNENIYHFGGDRKKITLFGQSAGAHSAMIHLTKSDSESYFRNVIIESLPFTIPLKSPPEARYLASIFTDKIGCTHLGTVDMECLRSKTADEIITAQTESAKQISSLRFLELFQPWEPWVDSVVVPINPINAVEAGVFFQKPVTIGTLTEEARSYIYSAFSDPVGVRQYILTVAATLIYPLDTSQTILHYPPTLSGDQREIESQLATDYVFGCSTRHVSRLMVSSGVNLWLYTFDHALSFGGGWRHESFCEDHVCHGEELPLVFQTASLSGFKFSDSEIVLSDFIITLFTNFAKHSDPNGLSGTLSVDWPCYEQSNNWSSLLFQTPNSNIIHNYRTQYCDFNDKIGYLPFEFNHFPIKKPSSAYYIIYATICFIGFSCF